MFGRMAAAIIDANQNRERSQDTTADGQLKFKIKVQGSTLHHTAQHCTALHCTALHCRVCAGYSEQCAGDKVYSVQ